MLVVIVDKTLPSLARVSEGVGRSVPGYWLQTCTKCVCTQVPSEYVVKSRVQVNLVLVQVLIELLCTQDLSNAHQLYARGREGEGGGAGMAAVRKE